jgi:hypothetical protein
MLLLSKMMAILAFKPFGDIASTLVLATLRLSRLQSITGRALSHITLCTFLTLGRLGKRKANSYPYPTQLP